MNFAGSSADGACSAFPAPDARWRSAPRFRARTSRDEQDDGRLSHRRRGGGIAGCGTTSHFVNRGRPSIPVNLAVYIGNARVAISPATARAGPVVFDVTNQASRSESLTIAPRRGGQLLATTGPINPDSTAQVTVDFPTGEYSIATGSGSGEPPSVAPITPATLRIGPRRGNADGALLQP